jgi:restriction system protein
MNTKQNKQKGPEFIRFFRPILDVLKELGGSGSAGEVIDLVIDKMNISDEELSVLNKNGGSRIRNQVNWARMYLVNHGTIDNSKRGIWSLTQSGNSLQINSHLDAVSVFKQVQSTFKTEAEPKSEEKHDGPELENQIPQEASLNNNNQNHRDELITILRNLTPNGFERICQRLLRESGFKKVIVTGKTGDGGIDGEGILEINPLITFKVIFQCKKYAEGNSIGSATIRDFRGAMQGRADKGIIITTTNFTKEAKKEAIRDGVPPIELVDAEGLIDLFEMKELGVKPRTILEIDANFFKEYQQPEQ